MNILIVFLCLHIGICPLSRLWFTVSKIFPSYIFLASFPRPQRPKLNCLGSEICLPRCRQSRHRLWRRRQGVHWSDGYHHRVAVDLVSHTAPVLNRGQQGKGYNISHPSHNRLLSTLFAVRDQRAILVCWRSHHSDHHLLHPLDHVEDESTGG